MDRNSIGAGDTREPINLPKTPNNNMKGKMTVKE
jgi:hypothetical protein